MFLNMVASTYSATSRLSYSTMLHFIHLLDSSHCLISIGATGSFQIEVPSSTLLESHPLGSSFLPVSYSRQKGISFDSSSIPASIRSLIFLSKEVASSSSSTSTRFSSGRPPLLDNLQHKSSCIRQS